MLRRQGGTQGPHRPPKHRPAEGRASQGVGIEVEGACRGAQPLRRDAGAAWDYRVKLSEDPIKVSNPGIQQVRRYAREDGSFAADVIFEETLGRGALAHAIDAPTETFATPAESAGEDLLVPVLRGGALVYTPPPLAESRARTIDQLQRLGAGVRQLQGPDLYAVGLDERLQGLKDRVIAAARGGQ